MNKKGFASSTIIYGLLSVFLIAISILIYTMNSNVSLNKSLNEKTIENIEYGTSSINELENRITELEGTIIDKIYPVGSVYISTTDDTVEKVEERFGGTWEVYAQGRTLVGVGTDDDGNILQVGQTGGSSSISLDASNIPSHLHTYTPAGTIKSTFTGTKITTSSNGSHTHSLYPVGGVDFTIANGRGSGTSGIPTSVSSWGSYGNADWFWAGYALSNSGDHTHTVTAKGTVASTFNGTASNTTTCTNCNASSFSIQDPYIVTYMYKRIK